MDDHRCYWCEYDDRGDPCRTDGVRDHDRMAATYAAYWARRIADEPDEGNEWVNECVSELEREAPKSALWFILLALDQVKLPQVLAVLAAGPMENVLCHGGPQVIGAIEAIARKSPKFRLLLSGSWGRNRMEEEIWRRASAAAAKGPRFCDDPRTLGHGVAGREASESEIASLLATSTIADLGGWAAARALTGLVPEAHRRKSGRASRSRTRH